jgi:hypothetical protein
MAVAAGHVREAEREPMIEALDPAAAVEVTGIEEAATVMEPEPPATALLPAPETSRHRRAAASYDSPAYAPTRPSRMGGVPAWGLKAGEPP